MIQNANTPTDANATAKARPRVILSAEDERRVRLAAQGTTSKLETARMMRVCDEYERNARALADDPTVEYALALCACWRAELWRRRLQIDQDAEDLVRGVYGSLDNSFYTRGGGIPLHGRF